MRLIYDTLVFNKDNIAIQEGTNYISRYVFQKKFLNQNMITKIELEKRIEKLEKEVSHLKAGYN